MDGFDQRIGKSCHAIEFIPLNSFLSDVTLLIYFLYKSIFDWCRKTQPKLVQSPIITKENITCQLPRARENSKDKNTNLFSFACDWMRGDPFSKKIAGLN